MCFIIDENYPDEQISKEDIVCYKILIVSDADHHQIVSPVRHHLWFNTRKKEASVKKTATIAIAVYDKIHEGLHSYSTLAKAKLEVLSRWYIGNNARIYEAIIPVGTKYFYNSDDREYVSESLIVNTNKILFKKFKNQSA